MQPKNSTPNLQNMLNNFTRGMNVTVHVSDDVEAWYQERIDDMADRDNGGILIGCRSCGHPTDGFAYCEQCIDGMLGMQ